MIILLNLFMDGIWRGFAWFLVRSIADLQKLLISTVWFDIVEHPLLSRWWSSLRLFQLSPVIDAVCTSHLHLPVFSAVCASYLISHPEMSQPPPISRHINHPSCQMIALKSQCAVVPHFARGKSFRRAFIPQPLIIPSKDCLLLYH